MSDKTGYELIRSRRKTVSLTMKPDGSLTVRAPLYMPASKIGEFVESHRDWIEKHRKKLAESAARSPQQKLTDAEISRLKKLAAAYFAENTAKRAAEMGLSYGRISIRLQKTRWGSCSSKKNLNFNCLLMLCPEEVRQYVIVHELCHLRHMDHSPAFWAMVKIYCPAFETHKKWLRQTGPSVIARAL